MDRHFDEDLSELKKSLLRMGTLAEQMVEKAARALLERNVVLTQDVFELEKDVNRCHIDLDDRCIKLIALHQPMAKDLRFIAAAMKINSELERIGDQAVNIGQTCTYYLFKETPVTSSDVIHQMADISRRMLKDSLDAFSRRDVVLAKTVLVRDEEEDNLKRQALGEFISLLQEEPVHTVQFVDMILISRNLERIGDHATNIAEDVIFMVLGKDIRHRHEEEVVGGVA